MEEAGKGGDRVYHIGSDVEISSGMSLPLLTRDENITFSKFCETQLSLIGFHTRLTDTDVEMLECSIKEVKKETTMSVHTPQTTRSR